MSVVISNDSDLHAIMKTEGLVYDEDQGGFGIPGQDRDIIEEGGELHKKLEGICEKLNSKEATITSPYNGRYGEEESWTVKYHDYCIRNSGLKKRVTLFRFIVDAVNHYNREDGTSEVKPLNRIAYVQCAYYYEENVTL